MWGKLRVLRYVDKNEEENVQAWPVRKGHPLGHVQRPAELTMHLGLETRGLSH